MKKLNKLHLVVQISRSMLVFCGVLLLFLILGGKAQANSGTFYHVHTDTCYETVELACTDHTTSIYTTESTAYCPYCERTCGVYIMEYTSHCPITGMSKVVSVLKTCHECGNIISSAPTTGLPAHTKFETNLICGKTEATPIARVDFSQSTMETTMEPVILSASISVLDEEFDMAGVTYSHDGGESWGSLASKSYTENGSYSIACKDIFGTTFSQSFVVDCIVKPTQAPVSTPVSSPTDLANQETNESGEIESEEIEGLENSSVEETSTSGKSGLGMQKLSEEEEVAQRDSHVLEYDIPSAVPDEDGICWEGILFIFEAKATSGYLKNGDQGLGISHEMEIIQDELEENLAFNTNRSEPEKENEIKEVGVTYILSSAYVRGLYVVGGLLFFVAFLGCIWYAYRNVMILYEVENTDRFFVSILFGMGKKERKVCITDRQIRRIATKEVLLRSFRQEKGKTIEIFMPKDKIRMPWEKEIRIRI